MRNIKGIIVHCSATREGIAFDGTDILKWHLERGFSTIGYHYIILLDGTVEKGRPEERIGAHCRGHNYNTLGICYIGGLDSEGMPKDTRTEKQKHTLEMRIKSLCDQYPITTIKGHRDYSKDLNNDGIIERWEWMKECPCFDTEVEYKNLIK
jgi:N-acetylmuramoyl-L-alanine amidase